MKFAVLQISLHHHISQAGHESHSHFDPAAGSMPACRLQASIGGLLAAVIPRARIVPAVRGEDMSNDPQAVHLHVCMTLLLESTLGCKAKPRQMARSCQPHAYQIRHDVSHCHCSCCQCIMQILLFLLSCWCYGAMGPASY